MDKWLNRCVVVNCSSDKTPLSEDPGMTADEADDSPPFSLEYRSSKLGPNCPFCKLSCTKRWHLWQTRNDPETLRYLPGMKMVHLEQNICPHILQCCNKSIDYKTKRKVTYIVYSHDVVEMCWILFHNHSILQQYYPESWNEHTRFSNFYFAHFKRNTPFLILITNIFLVLTRKTSQQQIVLLYFERRRH